MLWSLGVIEPEAKFFNQCSMVLNDESRAHSTGTLLVRRMLRCRVGAPHFLGQQSQSSITSISASGNVHYANVGMLDSPGHRHLYKLLYLGLI